MKGATLLPTFRDPAGSLSIEGDHVTRSIHSRARAAVLDFLSSSLCKSLEGRGDMVSSTVDDAISGLRLAHRKIAIPTYPWEWVPSQWLAAAELTLRICEEALDEGWILKDATPLNILFDGSRPVLVDVVSFERRDPTSAVWLAYGQYIRAFLLPLLMHQLLSWPLALSLFKRDGYEPADLYQALSWGQRLTQKAFWPITLPAWLDRRKGVSTSRASENTRKDPGLALHLIKRNLRDLRLRTQRAMPTDTDSRWSEYKEKLTHYTPAESEQKHTWVREVLEEYRPARVLDIGANTGEFSKLAAAAGAQVVAVERDARSAERIFCLSQKENLAIQTIHADLARPTPAAGWENGESSELLLRLEGQFELAMMLAVIHHLLLMEQIPLRAIIELCYRMTRRLLVIEWVPVEDPMYQSLMRGREDLYGSLQADDLFAACRDRFQLVRQHLLGNERTLYLFQRID